MKLWKYTGGELIGGAEITSDVILASEIEMPWESDKVEGIISMPNYATAPATGHKGLADQVLLERDGDAWQCVGHYINDAIIVFRRVQNTGLADILFLRCMEHRKPSLLRLQNCLIEARPDAVLGRRPSPRTLDVLLALDQKGTSDHLIGLATLGCRGHSPSPAMVRLGAEIQPDSSPRRGSILWHLRLPVGTSAQRTLCGY